MRFLILGDIMVDKTVYGKVNRISPEAPIPVLAKSGETISSPGGAANVGLNLASICPGDDVYLIGFISDELNLKFPDNLYLAFAEVLPAGKQMNTKLRFIDKASGYQLLRVDNEDFIKIKRYNLNWSKTYSQVNEIRPDAIIISDYGKGAIRAPLAQGIISMFGDKIPIIVDTRQVNPMQYQGATWITPNLKELSLMQEATSSVSPKALIRKLQLKQGLLLTKSEQGMELICNSQSIPVEAAHQKVLDTTGAGDTAVAAFTACILHNPANLQQALETANTLAGEVCQKSGTTVPDSTLADFGYNDQ